MPDFIKINDVIISTSSIFQIKKNSSYYDENTTYSIIIKYKDGNYEDKFTFNDIDLMNAEFMKIEFALGLRNSYDSDSVKLL